MKKNGSETSNKKTGAKQKVLSTSKAKSNLDKKVKSANNNNNNFENDNVNLNINHNLSPGTFCPKNEIIEQNNIKNIIKNEDQIISGNLMENISIEKSMKIDNILKEEDEFVNLVPNDITDINEKNDEIKNNDDEHKIENIERSEKKDNKNNIEKKETKENNINFNLGNKTLKNRTDNTNRILIKGVNSKPTCILENKTKIYFFKDNNNISTNNKRKDKIKSLMDIINTKSNNEQNDKAKQKKNNNFLQRLNEIDKREQQKADNLYYKKRQVFISSKANINNCNNITDKKEIENKNENNDIKINKEDQYQLLKKVYLSPFIYSEKFSFNNYNNSKLNDYLDGKFHADLSIKGLKEKIENKVKENEDNLKSQNNNQKETTKNKKVINDKRKNEKCLSYNMIMYSINEKIKSIRNSRQCSENNLLDKKILNFDKKNSVKNNSSFNSENKRTIYKTNNFYNKIEPKIKIKNFYDELLNDVNYESNKINNNKRNIEKNDTFFINYNSNSGKKKINNYFIKY